MQVINISQLGDREVWLQHRIGKVTGSKAKAVKPLSRGADRTPQGFWELLAEKLCIAPDGEKPIDRGQRLEEDALKITADKYNLNLNLDCGMWVSDDNEDIAVSPDGAENGDKPTYAAEAKCLSSANHLKYVIKDQRAAKADTYKAIDNIPNDAKNSYREQVIQYFVVNENLETLYFALYDDRVAIDKYVHHVIVVHRKDIEEDIKAQKQTQLDVLEEVNQLIKELWEE